MQTTPSAAPTEAQAPDRAIHGAPGPRILQLWQFVLVGVVLVIGAHLLDAMAWQSLRDPRVNERDWGRMLRTMGYVPLWVVLGLAVGLQDRGSGFGSRRGWLLVGAPLLSGAVAELCKLLLRRLRPDPSQFDYAFRAFADDPLSTRGLGMPSSHVMVAFGGAAVLARFFPETRALWFVLAAGCALTRVMSLGHFLSDTVAAAFLGVLVAWGLMRRWPAGVVASGSAGRHATGTGTAV
ncbi:MAG: phosphatase PAP2 family protein [Gemmatimonadota bacterium]